MSKLFSFSLYFISFAPLWLSVLFIDLKSCIENDSNLWTEKISIENDSNLWTEKISISCILIVTLICLIILMIELCTRGKEGTVPQTLKQTKEEKTVTAEFLLSYILPLFAFDFTLWDETLLFLIFFVTLGFLCIRHNYFSVNVVLELANFRFYTCIFQNEDGIETEQTVLSHRKLTSYIGETIYLKSLNNEYKLDIEQ